MKHIFSLCTYNICFFILNLRKTTQYFINFFCFCQGKIWGCTAC